MKVVNIKAGQRFTHYIGRCCYGYEESPFHNPYKTGTRKEKIQNFEKYARNNPELLLKIKELPEDAILGCWCFPKSCHGDIIIKLWEEMNPRKELKQLLKF